MHGGWRPRQMRVDIAQPVGERPREARVLAVVVEHPDEVAVERERPRDGGDARDGERRPPRGDRRHRFRH